MCWLVDHQDAQFIAFGFRQAALKLAGDQVIQALLGRLDVQLRNRSQEVCAALVGIDKEIHGRKLVQRRSFLTFGEMFKQGAGGQGRPLPAKPDQFEQQRNAGLSQFGKGPGRLDLGGKRGVLD
jgi:hypothetical protein